jgi:Domain of unknown function DUF29
MRPQNAPLAKPTGYDSDVILWAEEQARLLRAGRFAELDIEHIADEIEDVGKSEKRELASLMAVLLAHLVKWRFQPEKRTKSWRSTIDTQRKRIEIALRATPSLATVTRDSDWKLDTWFDARAQAERETGLEDLPLACPFTMDEARDPEIWPD